MQHPVCFSAPSTDTLAEFLWGLLDSRITDRRDSLHVLRSQWNAACSQIISFRTPLINFQFSFHLHCSCRAIWWRKNTQYTSIQPCESLEPNCLDVSAFSSIMPYIVHSLLLTLVILWQPKKNMNQWNMKNKWTNTYVKPAKNKRLTSRT